MRILSGETRATNGKKERWTGYKAWKVRKKLRKIMIEHWQWQRESNCFIFLRLTLELTAKTDVLRFHHYSSMVSLLTVRTFFPLTGGQGSLRQSLFPVEQAYAWGQSVLTWAITIPSFGRRWKPESQVTKKKKRCRKWDENEVECGGLAGGNVGSRQLSDLEVRSRSTNPNALCSIQII